MVTAICFTHQTLCMYITVSSRHMVNCVFTHQAFYNMRIAMCLAHQARNDLKRTCSAWVYSKTFFTPTFTFSRFVRPPGGYLMRPTCPLKINLWKCRLTYSLNKKVDILESSPSLRDTSHCGMTSLQGPELLITRPGSNDSIFRNIFVYTVGKTNVVYFLANPKLQIPLQIENK